MCYQRYNKSAKYLKIKKLIKVVIFMLVFTVCFYNSRMVFAEPKANKDFHAKNFKVFMDNIFKKKMKEQHVPGAVITVVKDGKIIFSKGYGYSDLEKKILMTSDKTLVRTASVSKLFTYTAMMQLCEQGKIDLKDNVNKYLKGYTLKNDYSTQVTVEQLLMLDFLEWHMDLMKNL